MHIKIKIFTTLSSPRFPSSSVKSTKSTYHHDNPDNFYCRFIRYSTWFTFDIDTHEINHRPSKQHLNHIRMHKANTKAREKSSNVRFDARSSSENSRLRRREKKMLRGKCACFPFLSVWNEFPYSLVVFFDLICSGDFFCCGKIKIKCRGIFVCISGEVFQYFSARIRWCLLIDSRKKFNH